MCFYAVGTGLKVTNRSIATLAVPMIVCGIFFRLIVTVKVLNVISLSVSPVFQINYYCSKVVLKVSPRNNTVSI